MPFFVVLFLLIAQGLLAQAPSRTLTLVEAESIALERNPRIHAASNNADAAGAVAVGAKAEWSPTLAGSLTAVGARVGIVASGTAVGVGSSVGTGWPVGEGSGAGVAEKLYASGASGSQFTTCRAGPGSVWQATSSTNSKSNPNIFLVRIRNLFVDVRVKTGRPATATQ